MSQRHTTNSVEDTWALGESLGASLRTGDVVALRGELGAGKTQLVRGIAKGMGIDAAAVHSPTFVVMNEYAAKNPAPPPGRPGLLIHVDAYRLTGDADVETIGLDDAMMLADAEGVVVIEWPERIERLLPAKRIDIAIEHTGESQRVITIKRPGAEGTTQRCRVCGTPLPVGAASAVFCSDRCQLADLGKWFSGSYSISRELRADDSA